MSDPLEIILVIQPQLFMLREFLALTPHNLHNNRLQFLTTLYLNTYDLKY